MNSSGKEQVLITGGGGMIGNYLSAALLAEGYEVAHLSRSGDQSGKKAVFQWNPAGGILPREALEGADHIIHLAGANIGEKRWTPKRKEEIRKSRIDSAKLIHKTIRENSIRLKTFISASGIGYYGTLTSEKIFREDDLPADDFLGQLCREWEDAADLFSADGIRTVKLRTAVVLEKNDSALKRIIAPAKFGFLGQVGNGKQFMPWIHIKDLTGIYLKAVKDESMSGVFNAVSPQHITHKEFMRMLSKVIHRPLLPVPVPAPVIRLIYGEMAGIVLEGSRASSVKIKEAGYRFRFDNLREAMEDLFKRH